MSHRQSRRLLWHPSKRPTHRDNSGDGILTDSSIFDQRRHADGELEFHRIRNARDLDQILKRDLDGSSINTGNTGNDIYEKRRDRVKIGGVESILNSEERTLIITTPPQLSLLQNVDSSLVVGQEVALTVILLAVHREIVIYEEIGEDGAMFRQQHVHNVDYSSRKASLAIMIVYATLLIIVYYNQQSSWIGSNGRITRENQSSLKETNERDPNDMTCAGFEGNEGYQHQHQGQQRKKAIVRLSDGLFLAIMLRFISGVLRTLTASYSADTVYALAISWMVVHLVACDYRYANGLLVGETGRSAPSTSSACSRPPFLGGTVSLNAAFLSTALLVSRIKSNATSYAFVSSVVTLFAFYPASRHRIAGRYPNTLCELVRQCMLYNLLNST